MIDVHRLRATLRARPTLADALLAAGLLVAEVSLWLMSPPELRDIPCPWPLVAGYTALGLTAVALRRRFFWPTVGLGLAQMVVGATAPEVFSVESVAILILTYTAAAHLPFWRAVGVTCVLWTTPLVLITMRFDTLPQPSPALSMPYVALQNFISVLVPFLIGRTVHHRRAYLAATEERAQTADERQRELTARAVTEERQRIARELHDVVAHHVSVMGVLATASRRTLRDAPDAADETLATIEETGRTALREMRRLLDVMRTTENPADDLTPQPGIGSIASLVDQVREAGLPVQLTVNGEPGHLDPGISLIIYRIVQEALTNALKHAGKATATVRLDAGRRRTTVEISDTGRGPRLERTAFGHGLVGMRERVALCGGRLRIGPRPGGGFRVYAVIPTEAPDAGRSGEATSGGTSTEDWTRW